MGNIISFGTNKEFRKADKRNHCIFINRSVTLQNEDGETMNFPCIVLYEKETGIPLCYTGIERWVTNMAGARVWAETTLAKRASNICIFLNFILWETQIDRIEEVTVNDIRNFLKYYRKKKDGTERNIDTWDRCKNDVFKFLTEFYIYNKDVTEFSYNSEYLVKKEIIRNVNGKRKNVVKKSLSLNIKGPRTKHIKNRFLVHGYLDNILYEAKKHNSELVLFIALQAYAGLREGEIVNLKRSSIKFISGGYGRISKIEIDLTSNAKFNLERKTKTPTGSIKKLRVQEVYTPFLNEIKEYYEVHEGYLEKRHASSDKDAPLFLNKWGKPMTVTTYQKRVKSLFYDYFLPSLERECDKYGCLQENAPFIETYKEEYPGAHMFRHWFTMYLYTKARLTDGEIMRWRGDSNINSMSDYIHTNAEMIELYRNSSYVFQKRLLEDIC